MKTSLLAAGLATLVSATVFAGETLTLNLVPERNCLLRHSPQEVVVKIDLSAGTERHKSRRTPLNLAVVLDRSGSMTGAKIEKARQAAMQLVDRLRPDDIFSLVISSDVARVVVPAQRVEDKDALKEKIEAVAANAQFAPALMVLDGMLPGASGDDVCRQLRAQKNATPILMLTAKGQELDKVIGLDLGADDYVTKPFGVRELLARIQALLRRSGNGAPAGAEDGPFQIGSATIGPRTFQLKRGQAATELTAKEVKLLQVFHLHAGEVLSRDRLLNEVWGYNYYGTTRTLDQVIVQLRKKLGDQGGGPRHLLTIHGVGYKLVV